MRMNCMYEHLFCNMLHDLDDVMIKLEIDLCVIHDNVNLGEFLIYLMNGHVYYAYV